MGARLGRCLIMMIITTKRLMWFWPTKRQWRRQTRRWQKRCCTVVMGSKRQIQSLGQLLLHVMKRLIWWRTALFQQRMRVSMVVIIRHQLIQQPRQMRRLMKRLVRSRLTNRQRQQFRVIHRIKRLSNCKQHQRHQTRLSRWRTRQMCNTHKWRLSTEQPGKRCLMLRWMG